MKSSAHIKSHPLHPILVCFPIAFFTGTLVFDALYCFYDKPQFSHTARYLNYAGIGGALLAAVPGFVDYLKTVPPRSSAKKRAATHGLLNVAMLLLFVTAAFFRSQWSTGLILGVEAAGFAVMGIAGWMGGTLVHRNQIGVDIRYANAGKWKEETLEEKNGKIEIDTSDLEENQMKLLHVGKRRIAIAIHDHKPFAFDDRCPHRGGSLAAGSTACGTVQCPWHGSQFDVRSGQLKAGPSKTGIKVYDIKEENGKTYLILSP